MLPKILFSAKWLMVLWLTIVAHSLWSQLNDWGGNLSYSITNSTNTDKAALSYLLKLDTEGLVNGGLMAPDGADIRVSTDCQGLNVIPHYIEEGVGASQTKIWCYVDILQAGTTQNVYVFYNNPNATSTSSFDGAFPRQLILTTSDTLFAGLQTDSVWEYNYIEIAEEAVIKFSPLLPKPWQLRMQADKIVINGRLSGDGMGHEGVINGNGNGPGGGTQEITGGGGAAYGGAGGNGSYGTTPTSAGVGGQAYGSENGKGIIPGSGGGAAGLLGAGNPGASGGMAIRLKATHVEVNGSLTANGNAGTDTEVLYSPGGGSGGGILIETETLSGSGIIAANGGRGGNSTVIYYAGGGAGGGRVKVFSNQNNFNGTIQTQGGKAGIGGITPAEDGADGTVYHEQVSSEIDINPIPGLVQLEVVEQAVCIGDSVLVAVNTGYTDYRFLVDGVAQQQGVNHEFKFEAAALEHSIICSVVIGDCTQETALVTVHSNPLPEPELMPTNLGFCTGDSLRVNLTGSAHQNMWFLNGVEVVNNINLMYIKTAGNYHVVETSVHGCEGYSDTLGIDEFEVPVPELLEEGNLEYCDGDSLLLTALNTANHHVSWKKTGLVKAQDTAQFAISNPGSYSLEYVSIEGCVGEPFQFVVMQNPTPQLLVMPQEGRLICDMANTSLSVVQGSQIDSLQWFFNGGALLGENDDNLAVSEPGLYWLQAFSNKGCTQASDSTHFQMFPNAVIDTVSSHQFCVGDRVSLQTTDLDELDYQWFRNAIPISGATSFEHSFNKAGFMQVSMQSAFGCSDTSAPVELVRHNFPNAPSISQHLDTLFANVEADSYQWYLDGNIFGSTNLPYLITVTSGNYVVVAINGNSCASETSDSFFYAAPNTIGELQISTVNIYPNPSDGVVTVTSDATTGWFLLNSAGKTLKTGVAGPQGTAISIGQSGWYVIQLHHQNGQVSYHRLVIK